MTKAAKAFGKDRRLQNFWASPDTLAYVDEFEKCTGINSISSKRGRTGGTFCHPKLAVFFARWLDVRFAVWCDLMIDNILRGNIQTTVAVPTEEAVDVEALSKMSGVSVNIPRSAFQGHNGRTWLHPSAAKRFS